MNGADAVSALLGQSAFSKDFDLKDQLSRSGGRIGPLIAEGFGQTTDRHLAVYLGRARGSSLETIAHLESAARKRYISEAERVEVASSYTAIVKMLTKWMGYLRESDWDDRG